MNCNDYHREIILAHAGELPEDRRPALDAHLQLCSSCARFNHEVMTAAQMFHDGSLAQREIDLWPEVQRRIHVYQPLVPRWVSVPALSVLLLGVMFTKTFFRMQPQINNAEMEIVQEFEFLTDYDLWENMDVLESSDQSSQPAQPS